MTIWESKAKQGRAHERRKGWEAWKVDTTKTKPEKQVIPPGRTGTKRKSGMNGTKMVNTRLCRTSCVIGTEKAEQQATGTRRST